MCKKTSIPKQPQDKIWLVIETGGGGQKYLRMFYLGQESFFRHAAIVRQDFKDAAFTTDSNLV